MQHARGVIPVAEGARYELVFQDYRDGEWSVIDDPTEPPIQYVGFGKPLSDAQLEAMAQPRPR